MGYVSNITRKIVFWNYPRTSWQWDVLCVLILAFIFLTPKSWFASKGFQQDRSAVSTIILPVELVGTQPDSSQIESRARIASGRPNATIGKVRAIFNAEGKVTGYEVDIR